MIQNNRVQSGVVCVKTGHSHLTGIYQANILLMLADMKAKFICPPVGRAWNTTNSNSCRLACDELSIMHNF